MTAELSTLRSPLDSWTDRFRSLEPDVFLVEQPFRTQLTVRFGPSTPDTLLGVPRPATPCTATHGTDLAGEIELLWLGPDELLVLASPGRETELATALESAGTTAIDTSAQRTTLTLGGPSARDLLAHGCAIDLHPRAAPSGTCVQTLLARTGVVLVVEDATAPEFTLLVRASFADYLAEWLVTCAA